MKENIWCGSGISYKCASCGVLLASTTFIHESVAMSGHVCHDALSHRPGIYTFPYLAHLGADACYNNQVTP